MANGPMNVNLHNTQVSAFISLSGWLVELADVAHGTNWQIRSEVWFQMRNKIMILCWKFGPLLLHMVIDG